MIYLESGELYAEDEWGNEDSVLTYSCLVPSKKKIYCEKHIPNKLAKERELLAKKIKWKKTTNKSIIPEYARSIKTESIYVDNVKNPQELLISGICGEDELLARYSLDKDIGFVCGRINEDLFIISSKYVQSQPNYNSFVGLDESADVLIKRMQLQLYHLTTEPDIDWVTFGARYINDDPIQFFLNMSENKPGRTKSLNKYIKFIDKHEWYADEENMIEDLIRFDLDDDADADITIIVNDVDESYIVKIELDDISYCVLIAGDYFAAYFEEEGIIVTDKYVVKDVNDSMFETALF